MCVLAMIVSMSLCCLQRVAANAPWSLFCPNEAPGLADVWGDEFKALYERYEAEGRARTSIPAQKLWFAIMESQIETGTPYLLYKVCVHEYVRTHLVCAQCVHMCMVG